MKVQQQHAKGFTLIELMITVAIVGIIAAAAWPSFERYQQKGRRADGIGALMQSSAQLEKCFMNASPPAYTDCTVSDKSPRRYYDIATSNMGAETYTLTASPAGAQAGDTECATLTINQLGEKDFTTTSTSPPGTLKRCWSQ